MQPQKIHYPALDGLRGFAILVMLSFHNFAYISVTQIGWASIDLFFALSGFLITDILLNEKGSGHFLRNFYMRRILRIFPIYYLSLIIIFFILPNFPYIADKLQYHIAHQQWLWLYVQNWLFILKGEGNNNLLNHFWSLAIEEQFYWLWPPVILLVRKTKNLLIVIALTLVILTIARIVVWYMHVPRISYVMLYAFTRIDGLCIGCALAVLKHTKSTFVERKGIYLFIILLLLNIPVFYASRIGDRFPYLAFIGYPTVAVFWGLLVNSCMSNNRKLVDYFFNSGILRYFGKISYALYIFHWPLYFLAAPVISKYLLNRFHFPWFACIFTASIACTAIAILLSIFSYNYIEKYFLRLKKYFNDGHVVTPTS